MPFFFTALVSYQHGDEKHRLIALAIFVAATLTDILDGFLARVLKGGRTELGTFLDPLADKLLLLSGFLGLLVVPTLPHHPPLWITVTIVFRDLVILGGLFILLLMENRIDIQPNFLGKLTTAAQMGTLIAILLKNDIAITLAYLTAALTVASGFVYCRRELQRLKIS